MDGGKTAAGTLLANPNFLPSENAAADLRGGLVDPRLVAALSDLAREHEIQVPTIKTGHPMGPLTPGGKPSDHHHYRAADVYAVDGKPVRGNAIHPDVLDVGKMLANMPVSERPDVIFGPAGWHAALGSAGIAGFVSDGFHDEIHHDHLHLGFDPDG